MGTPRAPQPARLIAGILAATLSGLDEARAVLAAEVGAIEATSEARRWTESDYYEREMGTEIWRQFVSFATLIDPGELPAVKLRTNAIENRWCSGGSRLVNIDPGYICPTKLVLASTKDAAHRVYLRDGIYGESTLRYACGSWQPYSYTYRDYASASSVDFFNEVRARFLAQRRVSAKAGGARPAAGVSPMEASPAVKPGHRSRFAGRA